MLNQLFDGVRRCLFLWVRTDVINQNDIDASQPVYYVLQSRSLADRCVLEEECLRLGLPSSRQGHTLYVDDSFLSWSSQRNLAAQLQTLLGQTPSQRIQIVPVTILWGRSRTKEQSMMKALLSTTWSRVGPLRKALTVIMHGRQTLVQFSRHISLNEIAEKETNPLKASQKLARVLRVHFHLMRTAMIGPDLSHRRTLVNSLLQAPAVKKAIELKARGNKKLIRQSQIEARSFANEIAADYSYAVLRFMEIVLTWLWNKLYNGVEIHGLERLQTIAARNEIIYVPCHRSHIDYLLLSYVLQRNGLMVPHIAAGINLNMPVIGPILRRSGAFFIRRTFTNKLYTAVFDEYMHKIIQRGFSVEYFIEGGRSRTGRLRTPKTGMLSFSVRSFLRDHRRPLVFMPVYIGYEKIFEGRTYLNELRGQAKKDESLRDVFGTLKQLKDNYGKVGINFGEPIFLSDLMNESVPNWKEAHAAEEEKPSWLPALLDTLALKINQGINASAIANPTALVALALLSAPQQALPEKTLIHLLNHYRSILNKTPLNTTHVVSEDSSEAWIAHVEKEMRLLQRSTHPLGDVLKLDGDQAILMTYYRNNLLHLFALPSLIACLFNHQSSLSKKQITVLCQLLYPYLHGELYLPWHIEQVPEVVESYLGTFSELGLIERIHNHYRRNEAGTAIPINISLLSQAIMPTLERFYIVFTLLNEHGSGQIKMSELEQRSQSVAESLSILHGLHAPEFCDKSLFTQFIQLLREHRLITVDDDKKIIFGEVIARIMDDARRVLSEEIRLSIADMVKH